VIAGRLHASAAAAVLRRDLIAFTSYRGRFVTQNLGILFTLAVFYFLARLVHVPAFPRPSDYFAYVVVGLLILQVLQATLEAPTIVRQELVAGTFERMVVSPFGPVAGVLSLFLFPILYSIVVTTVALLVATAVFGLHLAWATAPLAAPVAVVGSLAFAAIALVFVAMTVRYKQAPGSAYVLAMVALVAGFYFPPSLLPWWLRWLSDVQPFTPAVDLLRHLLVGTELRHGAWAELGKLVGFSAVLVPLGVGTLSVAIRASQLEGTITEY
jgi:oleandomycin transport system permease protein